MNTIKRGSVWAVLAIVAAFVVGCSDETPAKVSVSADTMFTSVEHVEAAFDYIQFAEDEDLEEAVVTYLKINGMPTEGSYSPHHISASFSGDLTNKLALVLLYYMTALNNGEIPHEEAFQRIEQMLMAVKESVVLNDRVVWPVTINF